MKFKITLIAILLASVAINGCKKEDGAGKDNNTSTGKITDAEKANLYDVVWYSTLSSGGIDLEFLSDGTYRQAKALDGTWVWQNNGDTMNIVDYQGKKFNYVFDEVSKTIMKYRSSVGGDNYKTQFTYSTTK